MRRSALVWCFVLLVACGGDEGGAENDGGAAPEPSGRPALTKADFIRLENGRTVDFFELYDTARVLAAAR